MKLIMITLVGLFLLLQYELWFSHGSLITTLTLKRSVAYQQQVNTSLAKRNAVIQADIQNLKHSNQAVEERARNDLGMVKKGEIFYQVVKR